VQFVRPIFAAHPRCFGKGQERRAALAAKPAAILSDDLKLFAATFVAGFLFVSILIG
jgi:hypothetical protein